MKKKAEENNQKSNSVNIVTNKQTKIFKFLNIVGIVFLILIILSFIALFFEHLKSYFDFASKISLSGLILTTFIMYILKPYKFIGTIEFLDDSIIINSDNNTIAYKVTDFDKIKVLINKYKNQVDFLPGNMFLNRGDENFITFYSENKNFSFSIFIENSYKLIEIKAFLIYWSKNKKNIFIADNFDEY